MVHRALLGSLERFFGVLIEHYAGAFPLWLAPVQAVVIPVTERHQDYAREVAAKLRAHGVRVHVDDRNERLGYKIREAQLQKVPYMLVVGDKEVEARQRLRAPPPGRRPRRAADVADLRRARIVEARGASARTVEEDAGRPSAGGVQ